MPYSVSPQIIIPPDNRKLWSTSLFLFIGDPVQCLLCSSLVFCSLYAHDQTTVDLLSFICSNLLLRYYHVIFAAVAWFAAVVQIWRLQLWSRSRGDSRELWQEWSDAVPQAGRPTCHIGQSFIPLYLWNITVLYSTKYGVKLQTLGTCSLHKSHWTPEALYNLGSDSWLANDTAAHYAAIHCVRQQTIGLLVPPVKRSTVGSRAFLVAGPKTRNALTEDVTSLQSEYSFRRQLKTQLFNKSFSAHHHLILTILTFSLGFCSNFKTVLPSMKWYMGPWYSKQTYHVHRPNLPCESFIP